MTFQTLFILKIKIKNKINKKYCYSLKSKAGQLHIYILLFIKFIVEISVKRDEIYIRNTYLILSAFIGSPHMFCTFQLNPVILSLTKSSYA